MTTTSAALQVEAAMTYCVRTAEKPVSATFGPDGLQRSRTGVYEDRRVTIRDGRPLSDRFSLDREGFVFVRHDTKMRNFFDPEELGAVYYPEMERLVKQVSGASRVVIFDHTLRSGSEETRQVRKIREPVRTVHNDYTEWSGPQRVRDLLPAEADSLLRHRFCVIQVWRPIQPRIESAPLAICDAQTVAPEDLIPTERSYPDRKGEIYHVAYNPRHRWYWFPHMARDEALVFKCYDSLKDGRARFTAHSAFDDPATPLGAAPRESIEIRTFAFFGPV